MIFARLLSSHTPKPSNPTPFALYGSRHKWLDSVFPFRGGEGEGSAESADMERGQRSRQGQLQDLMQLQVRV